MIAGTVVSGLVLGTASVMNPVPGSGAPEATAIEVPAGSEFDQSRDDTQADLPAAQETPAASEVAQLAPPSPDDLSVIDSEATLSALQPETGDNEVAMLQPDTAGTAEAQSGFALDAGSDAPVTPRVQTEAPAAPESEQELSISTEPAQPALPEMSEENSAFPTDEVSEAAETPGNGDRTDESALRPDTETGAQPGAPTAPDTPGVALQDNVTAPRLPVIEAPDSMPDTAIAGAKDAPPADLPDDLPEDLPEDLPDSTPGADSGAPDATDKGAAVAGTDEAASGAAGDKAANVTTDRLPSVGLPTEPEAEEDSQSLDIVDFSEGQSDLPPFKRYATEFDNPDGKPLMSIVLIDDGSSPIGLDALESFPYPLSFAVDTGWAGAPEAMKAYRAAGFEVLAMINLPEGAEATQTEVAMQSYLQQVPEAVAIMEGQGGGLQASREVSEQMAQILRDAGLGAVLFAQGLNTAQKLIAREGVPSASVFRDFDAKGQDATVIRRFLDQAAFRAAQEENGVIMVGRLRPDTISALLLWGLQDRASRVAIAPVTAVLGAE